MPEKIRRRDLLIAASTATVASGATLEARPSSAAEPTEGETLARTICLYCAVGCGVLVRSRDDRVVHVEGDPDHPINEGSLCAKASALVQLAASPLRLGRVKYRAPGANDWVEKDWDWAIERIAERIQTTRDAAFVHHDEQGRQVRRTEAVGWLGGAALNNEECYAGVKLARALGIVHIEHQARLCHSPTVAGLAATFGRGAMTNHWIDLIHADCILVIGANVAENHPIAMKWIGRAQDAGGRLVVVDPRFTRTASVAQLHVPIRPGTDIALVGYLIREAIEQGRIDRDYLVAHTDAPRLLDGAYSFQDGRFGPIVDGDYDRTHWAYQHDADGQTPLDPTLQDPNCVFQRMRHHFDRHTVDRVSAVCGTPVETLQALAKEMLRTAGDERAGAVLFAMGTTQHAHGTQNVRALAILQLLLGNIGVSGGGVNALRGESNVQGSTDHGLLYHQLPGYLEAPSCETPSLAAYLARAATFNSDPAARLISLLKAWWPTRATAENDFAFDLLPKHAGNGGYRAMFDAMHEGRLRGLLVWGQNPAVSGPRTGWTLEALEQLDWLVTVDLFQSETAAFWKRPGTDPATINTEVFLLPAASALEKEGSLTNSGRWVQWRESAAGPPREAQSDLWILNRLAIELKRRYAIDGISPEPITELSWNPCHGLLVSRASEDSQEHCLQASSGTVDAQQVDPHAVDPHAVDPHVVAREINGRGADGQLLEASDSLSSDGSTAAGNSLYRGSYTEAGNQMARRIVSDPRDDPERALPDWSWSWPANERILYRGGLFTTLTDARARLFAPVLPDGPLPEHYEPVESPADNAFSSEQVSPILSVAAIEGLGNRRAFPVVATTCRVAEHWQAGAMTRNLPWLVELVPNVFAEISRELAASRGIRDGDKIRIRSARGTMTAYALVTGRLKPMRVGGRLVEVIAIVWHFGYQGLATGDSANHLTSTATDPSSGMPEFKAFLCQVDRETS